MREGLVRRERGNINELLFWNENGTVLLKLMDNYSKVGEYKVNKQTLIAFLSGSNEHLEAEIENTHLLY